MNEQIQKSWEQFVKDVKKEAKKKCKEKETARLDGGAEHGKVSAEPGL